MAGMNSPIPTGLSNALQRQWSIEHAKHRVYARSKPGQTRSFHRSHTHCVFTDQDAAACCVSHRSEGTMTPPSTQLVEQLTNRDVRALTEYMTVLSNGAIATNAPGLYTVISKAGRSYTVDLETGACECNDAFYHQPSGGCAHVRRVEFATGRRQVPEWVDETALDDQLKHNLNADSCGN